MPNDLISLMYEWQKQGGYLNIKFPSNISGAHVVLKKDGAVVGIWVGDKALLRLQDKLTKELKIKEDAADEL